MLPVIFLEWVLLDGHDANARLDALVRDRGAPALLPAMSWPARVVFVLGMTLAFAIAPILRERPVGTERPGE